MAEWLFHLCEQLEATSLGVWVRESIYGFPILVAVHIITLVFSVGIVVWLDLRLVGVSMTGVPVSRVYRRLMPLAFVGFAVMVLSGGTLLTGFATSAYRNPYFGEARCAVYRRNQRAPISHEHRAPDCFMGSIACAADCGKDGGPHFDRRLDDGDSGGANDVVHAVYPVGIRG